MIGAVREWLTSIVLVTLLLTILRVVLPEGAVRKIFGFTGGLILLITIVQPVLGLDAERLQLRFEEYEAVVAERQKELEQAGEIAMAEIIAERAAAYISDKADTLGLGISVRVETERNTDGLPVPASAELTGVYSQELAVYMEKELGIPRERQVWHE